MAVDRPTFDESWHRVADLRPRLRSIVQEHRQSYRGQIWHVYRDPGNNKYFRLPAPVHGFVGLLDGRRTVSEAWEHVNDRFGDDAPTQGEAIQALGMLYTSNLLHGDLPPDAKSMLSRQTQRMQREVKGYLQNFLFAKIPLFDPEPLLRQLTPLLGWVFSWVGLVLWIALLGFGVWEIAGRGSELWAAGKNVLEPDKLYLLFVAMAGLKLLHELGHGISCKQMAKHERGGGEVRTLGVMLLVLIPMPYVDATSSWSFRSRWRRIIVTSSGMYVEIAMAAIAAIIWARTGEGSFANIMAFNVMFLASVTTILFNANPLIRFDGYYILSDLLEVPNLYQRSQDYLKYLCKKYLYAVRRPKNPATLPSEPPMFVIYGIASLIYRIVLFVGIYLFVFDKVFYLGVAVAIMGFVAYFVVPVVKLIHYLVTSGELLRTRNRAVIVTGGLTALILGFLGFVPWQDYDTAVGIIEPRQFQQVSLGESGYITESQIGWKRIDDMDQSEALVMASNRELSIERERLLAQQRELRVSRQLARATDPAEALMLTEKIQALQQQLELVEQRLAGLTVYPSVSGTWLAEDTERWTGTYQKRGVRLGVIASLDDLVARLVVDQNLGPRLAQQVPVGSKVELRVKGRPQETVTGTIEAYLPTGYRRLPSQALSQAAGGSIATRATDPDGLETQEQFMEVRIRVDMESIQKGESLSTTPLLLPGQRVVARFELPERSLLSQGVLALRQMLQRRFNI